MGHGNLLVTHNLPEPRGNHRYGRLTRKRPPRERLCPSPVIGSDLRTQHRFWADYGTGLVLVAGHSCRTQLSFLQSRF